MTAGLVGRAADLERLAAVFGDDDGLAAALVIGEPGVGKSRLISEVARRSARPVLGVVGYESGRNVPLTAAGDLLRQLTGAPEHGSLLDEIAFGPLAATAPTRVFEAAHRALSSGSPALVLVDDLQWVDDLSLALLQYVLRAAASSGSSLHLLAAGRDVARSRAFAEEVGRLLPESSSLLLDLDPLAQSAAVELALELDSGLGHEAASAIAARSAGVPFWIEALVRSGERETEARKLLTGRLRDTGRDASAVLGLLAVLARPVAVDDACELLGWPPSRIEEALEDLVSRGVAVRAGASGRIAHDLLREAAFDELGERQRRELHRRIADWLEEIADDDVGLLREALEHRLGAGERPIELAARLATSPQRRRLGTEGLATLVAVAEECDASSDAGQALLAGTAALAFELGEHELALERWTSLAAVAAEASARFDAYLGASKAAFGLGWAHAERAHDAVDAALECARTPEQVVAARAHEARIVLWLDHQTEEGAALARQALEQSRRLGATPSERRVQLDALQAALNAAMQKADGEEILALGHEMIRVTLGRDQDAYVEALLARANGEARTGPLFRAEATLREAWDLATKRALTAEAADAAFRLAVLLHDSGRLDEADQVVSAAEELAGRVERVFPARLIAHELALLRGGDINRAVERYEAAIDGLPDPHVRIWPRHIAASFLSRARREAARVVALLEAAERDSQAARCPRCMVTLQVAAAETLARLGRQDEAEEQLARAEALPALDAINRFLRLHARALVTAGRDGPRGAEMLAEVCAEGERLGRRIDVLWAKLDLARLIAAQDPGRAAGLLRDVAGAADAVGAMVPRLVAEQELRRLGVRTWRRGAATVEGHSLTPRERQIVELVARGASNPEIAQELFVSRKTVERHVSNVLAKFGARNRVELVALMARKSEGAPR